MKEWKPAPSLDWRLDFGYVVSGDIDTAEAKKYTDLTHLNLWKARYMMAETDIKVPKDIFSGYHDPGKTEEDTREDFLTLLYLASPFGLSMEIRRWAAQAQKKAFGVDVNKLTPKITAYIQAHGGNQKSILKNELDSRLVSGKILLPDLTIKSDFSNLPISAIKSRCERACQALDPVKDVFVEDYKYWNQVKIWCDDFKLAPKERKDKNFYDGIAFNPQKVDPKSF